MNSDVYETIACKLLTRTRVLYVICIMLIITTTVLIFGLKFYTLVGSAETRRKATDIISFAYI